jgi:uncharacterized membrane protein
MLSTHLGPSADLPPWAVGLACMLAIASLALLLVEMRRRERGGAFIAVSGLLAVSGMMTAMLRPVRVSARESSVGPRVVVLADASRSMALPGDKGLSRQAERDLAIARLSKGHPDVRFAVLGFGDGPPSPLADASRGEGASARAMRSDLGGALRALAASPEERPAAVVVVSDGRLDDPPEDAPEASLRALGDEIHVPIHAIAAAHDALADASVRRVTAAGAAVAHAPLPIRVEVGCAGGLPCDELTVTARELRDDGPPAVLASGLAHVKDGTAVLDLTITLERAGARIVEIAIGAPPGDVLPENDRRLVTFNVSREHVRVLHVAGRPTNDVAALRQWLKSDTSVDVIAFFILRTMTDDARASQNELALIPFPVDQLFTDQLPTFDAVVLQDFDAQPYGLERFLPNIQKYVRSGGGLVMVGGNNSFVAGGYAGTPLADVLPVQLDGSRGATSADTMTFVPKWTPEGLAAPLLDPLRNVLGDQLPSMPGANVLGDLRPGGVALWSHPTRSTRRGHEMPVLAIGEEGDGRTIALGVDGAWELKFSQLGADTAGRAHGALWDGLLGWLMRDPRFEAAKMEVVGGCTAGLPSTLHARVLASFSAASPAGSAATVALDVTRIDASRAPIHMDRARPTDGSSVDFALPALEAGAYEARLRVGGGTTTRHDFACEAGGDEWADSRPDARRLEALAKAAGGSFVSASNAESLPLPKPTVVSAERRVTPIAPPWVWTLAAAVLLGAHWVARRRSGLS